MLTAPMIAFGWPSPWVVLFGSLAAGWVARAPLERGRDPRRGGYIKPPASGNGNQGMAERVGIYTGYSPDGALQVVGGTSQTQPAPSRITGHTSSGSETATDGDTRRGRSAPNGAGTDSGADRLALDYRLRLSPAQRHLWDELRVDGFLAGALPPDAMKRLEALGPWPDPYDEGCAGCGK